MSWGELFKELCKDIWNLIDRFLDWFIDDYSKKIYRDIESFALIFLITSFIVGIYLFIYLVTRQ